MLSALILQVMLSLAPPGKSLYSVVVMPECGAERAHPRCDLTPICEPSTQVCAAPRWSNAHHAFVRQETAAEGRARYESIAAAIVAASNTATRPTQDEAGKEVPPVWPWPVADLARGLATIAYHESGFRRDVQEGVGAVALGDCRVSTRSGRAPTTTCHSVCLVQINMGGLNGSKWGLTGRDLVGLDSASMERCFGIGARILGAARARCQRWGAAAGWFRPTVYGYGSGASCVDHGPGASALWVASRERTYTRFLNAALPAPQTP